MATKAHDRADLRALRRKLEAARQDADGIHELFVQVADRFLTAAEYKDDALMRSAVEEARAALAVRAAERVDEFVQKRLE